MAKKQKMRKMQPVEKATEEKAGTTLKDLLGADALAKLKIVEKDLKTQQELAAQEAAEQARREKEERERNKSFAELLEEYDKKGGGKFS
ncbi:DUF3886 domain-containing protein [Brevibacillus fulvus]|uniref:DUF3886 domain-containing protein n=1 Tax=Brevibacillus fulvus TaxID=1125967 RepID=A0A938Y0E8_9BACL|nr:DUF3886 domain-containing protein [Brevibacillus fulvus]MBM7589746.1 hypothetical protein [Brevibacillus fulvus]